MASGGGDNDSGSRARSARSDLINAHQGLVRSIAWKIWRRLPAHVEIDDVVAYGMLGLAEASASFDSAHGVKFGTFAHHRVRGSILDGLRKNSWFSSAAFESGDMADDEPGAKRAGPARTAFDDPVDTRSGGGTGAERAELLHRLDRALAQLPPSSKELITYCYIGGMPLARAAELMGFSRSWASRLHEKALGELRTLMATG
ncbi:MAG: sigma-70 family RNA polymerase sigma factor [Planctomycetota bacterium]